MKIHFEKVTPGFESPLLIKEVTGKVFHAPLHFHPEIELTLILESSGKRFVGDSIENFAPGDLVLLGENIPHFWSNEKDLLKQEGRAHAIVVQFDMFFLGERFLKLSGAKHIENLLRESRRGVCLKGKTKDIVAGKLTGILHLDTFGRILLLLDILDTIARSKDYYLLASPNFSAYSNDEDCRKMNKIYNFVYANLTQPLDITGISEMLNMSVSAFSHYFKKRTQRTFTQFVNETRIGKAKKLLIETDDSIAEIGYACGYNSLSNFNKQFNFFTGSSPKSFRKEVEAMA